MRWFHMAFVLPAGDFSERILLVCDECDRKELMEGWTTGNASYDAIIRNTQGKADKHDFMCLR